MNKFKLASIFCFLFLMLVTFSAKADLKDHGSVKLYDLFSSPNQELAMQAEKMGFNAVLHFKLKKDWHIYWQYPGDNGYPPSIKINESTKALPLLFPFPKKFIAPGDEISFGYGNEVFLGLKLAPDFDRKESLHLSYLVCDPKVCVPIEKPVWLKTMEASFSPKIIKQMNKVPKQKLNHGFSATFSEIDKDFLKLELSFSDSLINSKTKIFFESITDHTLIFSSQKSFNKGLEIKIEKDDNEQINPKFLSINFNYLNEGGDIPRRISLKAKPKSNTSIQKKVESTTKTNLKKPSEETSKTSLFHIILIALLGGFILNFMPCVLPVLAIKVFDLVKKGESKESGKRDASFTILGIISSYLILAAASAFLKSIGEQDGWGIHFQNPLFVVILLFIIFILGLNMLGQFEIYLPSSLNLTGNKKGAFGSFFTGFLSTALATPCSAAFLGTAVGFALSQSVAIIFLIFFFLGIGMSLPYFFILFAPGLLKIIPKPGAWMATFKKIMAFLLFGTCLWLFYILMNQLQNDALILILSSLLLCGFAGLFLGLASIDYYGQKKARNYLILGLVIMVFSIGSGLNIASDKNNTIQKDKQTKDSIWERFSIKTLNDFRQKNRLIFVDVTADWCVTCKVNEKTILLSKNVQESFKKNNVVLLKADWTNRNKEIADYLQKFGKYGIPFYVVYGGKKGIPIPLPEIITPGIVTEAIQKASGEL